MRGVNWLYKTKIGRCFLKILISPPVSRALGAFLDCKASVIFIKKFIKSFDINIAEAEEKTWESFNDFFTRRLKDGARPVCMDKDALISPCDSYLTVYNIDEQLMFEVKNSVYSVYSILENKQLSHEFEGGLCLVFRLTPSHYHRYCYFDSGIAGINRKIPGKLHTVAPISDENGFRVFSTNSREYCVMNTDNFGKCVFMEVGAMFVGRIKNHSENCAFNRGDEKGLFEFGGSTVIVFLKKGAAEIMPEILSANENNKEYEVRYGQRIGKSVSDR